jgi:hypothetical protein
VLRRVLLCSTAALGLLSGAAFAEEAAGSPPPVPAQENPAPESSMPAQQAPVESDQPPEQVLVTATRNELIGQATTSSQGIILKQELQELPVYRAAQLLETVPGLVVTSHSGEGKANQYLIRGFNLDHGTDLATFIDDMPVNMRTHAHGQGYTDLNFFIPELATGIDYTKGPYFAAQGDYASVASVHIGYLDQIDDQAAVTVGTLGYQRLFTAGTRDWGMGHILGGLELVHYDGPWTHPDNVRKLNAVLRYSEGEAREGFSLTGMYYRGLWNATTDQPERAMDPTYMASLGVAPIGRFGTLDPTDAGQAQRMSLSGVYSHGTLDWHVDANAYVINSNLTLWNNFTHFLDDPVHGDQHAQNDVRNIFGGGVSYTQYGMLFGGSTETLVGVQGRYDDIHVDLLHTEHRVELPGGILEDDKVHEGSGGVYVQYTDYVNDWFRFILGAREDYFSASDSGTNAGSADATVFQPKASLVFTPFTSWEVYVSAGRGFHSNDFRGVASGGAFLAPSKGGEIGIRATPIENLTATLTVFQMEFRSELTYDADAGATSAGRPSRRTGVELNTTYSPFDWLEVYGSVSFAHSRYTDIDPTGQYIPDAPNLIGQLGIYVRDAGPWFGALELRYLGQHPLIEDNSQKSNGDQEWNMNVGYDFGDGLKAQLGIFNVFDSKDDAADYYYADRITPTEPLVSPSGNPDLHIHPLEPRAFRFTVSKTF